MSDNENSQKEIISDDDAENIEDNEFEDEEHGKVDNNYNNFIKESSYRDKEDINQNNDKNNNENEEGENEEN